ncbi:hypothetical protein NDA01_24150 [Trichocoleus desertorum AS-A10]|uniref:hypothetical protein n=1 Tax=Trichocoleus desertorum TaxID=1481672 RepID=UPI003296CBEB
MAQKQIVTVACGVAIAKQGGAGASQSADGSKRCRRVPDVMDCDSRFFFQRDTLCQGGALGANR